MTTSVRVGSAAARIPDQATIATAESSRPRRENSMTRMAIPLVDSDTKLTTPIAGSIVAAQPAFSRTTTVPLWTSR